MKKLLLLVIFIFALMFLPVLAVNKATAAELEGVVVEEITEVPSAIGLWWRGVKENISLAFTFDPVAKAEKTLKYAEERMKLAEVIAENSEDEKGQERVQAMVERAQELFEKVGTNQEQWQEQEQERVSRLWRNITIHQTNREEALDNIEENASGENLDRIREMRAQGLEDSQRLMNAVQNENVPEDVRGQLETTRMRIQEHVEEVQEYNEERHEIMQRIQAGDEDAEDELEELRESRMEQINERVEQTEQLRAEVGEQSAAKNGNQKGK